MSVHAVCVIEGRDGAKPMRPPAFFAECSVKIAPALLSGFEVGVTLPKLGNTIFKPRIVKLQIRRVGMVSFTGM